MTDLYDLAITAETLRDDLDRFVLAHQRILLAAQELCEAYDEGVFGRANVEQLRAAITPAATP
jgi:hypothetical protein